MNTFLKSRVLTQAIDEKRFNPDVSRQLKSIASQFQHKAGQIVLFTGESTSGKTLTAEFLTAEFLATKLGHPLYRIDLASLVSKYIGETEKNLSHAFDEAELLDAILLFDEADSLFGKRTQVNTAHDRFANQESSYLLQRIEAYTGLIILTANNGEDIDDTLIRNVTWQVELNNPVLQRRLSLWRRILNRLRKLKLR